MWTSLNIYRESTSFNRGVSVELLLKCSPYSGHALIKDLNLNVTKYRDTVYSSATLLVMCENVA